MQSFEQLIAYFVPDHYSLSVTLDSENKTFHGIVSIKGFSNGGQVLLHAKDLDITSVLIDGKKADWSLGEHDTLNIAQQDLKAGKHLVVIDFSGNISDAMHGLYPCYFEKDGERRFLFATQFESHHAREVFPCVDEPAAKATFDVVLTTESGITVLGNMPIKYQRSENDLLVTAFERTPRMSTYLLAWVTGDLQSKSGKTKEGVDVAVWATTAQDQSSLDFALETALECLEFFDDYFDSKYPLPKADLVALPDLSSGAMENWGLTTYRESALLAHPRTTSIASRQYIASVIAHELSHQWFGNLVTMVWWNDLWLNESFAKLMEHVTLDALHPDWNIWLDFDTHERIYAMQRDSLQGVQPVQVEVDHPDEISSLFDPAIVYAKGACLMRMLQNYIGGEAFRDGLKLYFSKHAYKNTVADDLWSAMSAVSGRDIVNLMDIWISQAGLPIVSVFRENNQKTSLTQKRFYIGQKGDTNTMWPIPLANSNLALPELLTDRSFSLDSKEIPLLNKNGVSYFVASYDEGLRKEIISLVKNGLLSKEDDIQIINNSVLLARAGEITHENLIPLIECFKHEKSEFVWSAVTTALAELRKFVETNDKAEKSLRRFSADVAAVQYKRLGWEIQNNESEEDTKLRSIIISLVLYGENPEALEEAVRRYEKTDIQSLDPELRPLILSSVVRHSKDSEIFDKLLEEYHNTSSADIQQDLCFGLTSTKSPERISLILETIKNSRIVRPQDVFRWFVYLIRGRESREIAWAWMQKDWKWLEETFSGDKSYDDYPRYAASGLMTRTQLKEYRKFFEPMIGVPALSRTIKLGINEIEGRVETIENESEQVCDELLKRYPRV